MNKYIWITENGKNRNEHRKIMEDHLGLGRILNFNEIIHHIDGNKSNNNINNLKLMSRSEHSKLHKKPEPRVNITCYICRKKYSYPQRYYNRGLKRGQKFMCSKKCVGLYAKQFLPHGINKREKYCLESVKKGMQEGLNGYEIQKKYGVSRKTVYKIKKKLNTSVE